MRICILYSELAGYILTCIETLLKKEGVKILLVKWPVNEEAPFKFEFDNRMTIIEKNSLSTIELANKIEAFEPELMLVSGWMDKDYVKIARDWKKRGIPVVSGLDNQWIGSTRQKIASMLSPLLVKANFTHMWATGLRQYEYARRLGFDRNNIRTGFYSADWKSFSQNYEVDMAEKKSSYPRVLLFVGRMVDFKGIGELCEAFLNINNRNGWKLKLIGAGSFPIPDHPDIEVSGFVQPSELPSLAKQVGAFILPSRKEPWGVVLHEFAAAGLPLIASDACGAADAFVRHGYNGYLFQQSSVPSLQTVLRQLMDLPNEELVEMGERSHALSRQITPEIWSETLYSLIN
ncbi:MAG: glycosyltransferase family 4 protein [Bacteroidota bacterium]